MPRLNRHLLNLFEGDFLTKSFGRGYSIHDLQCRRRMAFIDLLAGYQILAIVVSSI